MCSMSPWEDLCVFRTYLLFLLLMLSCFCGAKQGENWPEEMNSFNLESTWMAETIRQKWHEHVTKSLGVIFLFLIISTVILSKACVFYSLGKIQQDPRDLILIFYYL